MQKLLHEKKIATKNDKQLNTEITNTEKKTTKKMKRKSIKSTFLD